MATDMSKKYQHENYHGKIRQNYTRKRPDIERGCQQAKFSVSMDLKKIEENL